MAPSAARSDAKYGGTLQVGFFRKSDAPDGFRSRGTFDRVYILTSNEYILVMGRDGNYDPSESLAYAFQILDNGMRIRFYLREGAQFHKGFGEVTAEDAVWSLSRINDKAWNFPNPGDFAPVSKWEVVDKYTFDMVMKELDGTILGKYLYGYGTFVHSKKAGAERGPDKFLGSPISTGPFVVEAWNPGVDIKYSKHPQYWQKDKPYADALVVREIVEHKTRLAALQTGELHSAWLQAEQVPEASKDANIKVWPVAGVGWDGWQFTQGLPPFDDLRIRIAHVKAVDRKAINKTIYLNTLLDHNFHTYDPSNSPYGIDLASIWDGTLKYDPPAAKKLVEEYAKEKGLSLPLKIKGVCETRPDRQLFCEFLQASFKEVGMEFEFATVPAAGDRARVMEQCQTHITQTGSGVSPYAGAGLDGFGSWSGHPANFCVRKGQQKYDEKVQKKLDDLLTEAKKTLNTNLQIKNWKEVQKVALENVWQYVPAMLRVNYVGCHKSTGGCDKNPMWAHGFWQSQDFWITK